MMPWAVTTLHWLRARTAWLEALLLWMWAHVAVAWDEWHMARLHPLAPRDEWHLRIHRSARWRLVRDSFYR